MEAQRTAVRIGLSLDDFWRLTPREFRWHIEAHNAREEERLQLVATHGAWLCNALGVKPRVTPRKLLGREVDLTQMSETQLAEYMRRKRGW